MDEYNFKFLLEIIGLDVDDFINLLIEGGFTTQAQNVQNQFDVQMIEASEGKNLSTSESALNLAVVSNCYAADCLIQDSCLRFKQKGCNKDCKLYM